LKNKFAVFLLLLYFFFSLIILEIVLVVEVFEKLSQLKLLSFVLGNFEQSFHTNSLLCNNTVDLFLKLPSTFATFFKYLSNQSDLEKKHQKFCIRHWLFF